MPGFTIKHTTRRGPRSAGQVVDWMELQSLPQCSTGGASAARRAIGQVLYRVNQSKSEWKRGRCYHAMAELAAARDRARGIGCFTGNLSREQHRRLAKRWAFANKKLSKMHWTIMGSCLRDKPGWHGNEIVYAAAGRPTLSGPLAKAAPHDMRQIIRIAKDQGWAVSRTRKNHYRLCPPTPHDCVITSGTPSSQRSVRQALAQLRRSGLDI